ncbi:SipW-dependent-type signal peptide-containing protein [Candidatus Kaiserbacteria bacterium]|nr:SipW-dependent-type signal peptide-containing protein [Candidatus Kaiserbacteria bacterium]
MKKILTSLGMIVFVGALVAGGTGAFFSDTETSEGNVFTAGAIDLTVDSEQHYNNAVCVDNEWELAPGEQVANPQWPILGTDCDGTWEATDLGAHTFFNFDDIKPGDEGENTISLHVDNNDAYACVDVSLTKNDDVSSTEPELEAGDTVNTGSLFDGELAENMTFFAWSDWGPTTGFGNDSKADGEGDNIWQANEPKLFTNTSGPASDVLDGESYTLADSNTGALSGGVVNYIGLAWCAGTLDASVPGTITCDGGTMGNIAQTDSMEATIAFRVEQARNNENFECGDIDPVSTDVLIGSNDLAQSFGDVIVDPTKWLFYNDTNDTVMTINQFAGDGGANDIVTGPESTGAAQMILDTNPTPRYNIATYQFSATPLASISSLKYRIYDASPSGETPYLHFNVDFDNSDTWQRRLVQTPTGVVVNTWTEVDALAEMWHLSGGTWPIGTTEDGTTPGSTPKTWAEILSEYPTAAFRTTDSFFGVRVGHPGPAGEEGYVDWVEFDGVKYDFAN